MMKNKKGALRGNAAPHMGTKNHQEAAARLVDKLYIATASYERKKVKTSRASAHPDILRFHDKLLKELEERGYPFYAFYFYRSVAEQNRLYAKRPRVSNAKGGQSPHNYGCAVDIIHCKKLWEISEYEWNIIGAIGKEVARKAKIDIVWGGDWEFWDPAHWELRHWRIVRSAVKAGHYIPDHEAKLTPLVKKEGDPRWRGIDAYVKAHKPRRRS